MSGAPRLIIVTAVVVATCGSGCVLDRSGLRESSSGASGGTGGTGLVGAGGVGAGGATGGTSDPGGSGGVGGQLGPEDCLNGSDDNGDGLSDCDDPQCHEAGYSCVPDAAAVQSYVALTQNAASCVAPTTVTTFSTCDGCACTPGTATCPVSYTWWDGDGCQGTAYDVTGMACPWQTSGGVSVSMRALTAALGQASCPTEAAQVAVTANDACSLTQPGSCSAGGVCVPPVFQGVRTCVLVDAASPCPSSYTSARRVSFGGTTCTCDCALGQPACETPEVEAYYTNGDHSCSFTYITVPVGAGCTDLGLVQSIGLPASVPASWTCAASGTVTDALSAAKLCCL